MLPSMQAGRKPSWMNKDNQPVGWQAGYAAHLGLFQVIFSARRPRGGQVGREYCIFTDLGS